MSNLFSEVTLVAGCVEKFTLTKNGKGWWDNSKLPLKRKNKFFAQLARESFATSKSITIAKSVPESRRFTFKLG
jgi:hypothetical protein